MKSFILVGSCKVLCKFSWQVFVGKILENFIMKLPRVYQDSLNKLLYCYGIWILESFYNDLMKITLSQSFVQTLRASWEETVKPSERLWGFYSLKMPVSFVLISQCEVLHKWFFTQVNNNLMKSNYTRKRT